MRTHWQSLGGHALPETADRRIRPASLISGILWALGAMILAVALACSAAVLLGIWLSEQSLYVVLDDRAPLAEQEERQSTIRSPSPLSSADLALAQATDEPVSLAGPSLTAATPVSPAQARFAATAPVSLIGPTPPLPVTPWISATASLSPASPAAAAPRQEPTATPQPLPAVRIRIPAIGVDRSIVELPATYDARTRAWTRDTDRLFRRAGKDLVGHWGGSAHPGQEGNTIFLGHNYGVGYKGVFVRLGRLKSGQEVYLVNAAGRTFTYAVTSVEHVPWRRKNLEELMQHQAYLKADGPERLTLVTCGGANIEPFPQRIYVVAKPVR